MGVLEVSEFIPVDFKSGARKLRAEFEKRFQESGIYDFADPEKSDRELVRTGRLTDAQLAAIYSEAYGVEQLIEEEILLPDLPENSPVEFFNSHCCLPLEWNDDNVVMMVCDPYYLDTISFLAGKSWKCHIDPRFVRRPFLERLLSKLQNMEQEDDSPEQEDENTLRTMAGEARIVRLVNDIFTQAIELGASDIHIEPGQEQVSVRCRVDGVLTEIITAPLSQFPAIASRIKLLGGLNIAESRLPQDGRTNVRCQ